MGARRTFARRMAWVMVAAGIPLAIVQAWAGNWPSMLVCAAIVVRMVPILRRDRADQEAEEGAAAALAAGEVLDPRPTLRDSRFAYVPARPIDR